jgi:GntR family transcriptional regulator
MPTAPSSARPAAPAIDLSRSAVSRYIQLATLFRRRIDQGVWRHGEQIPTVDELAVECGVARATIRAKGTFVRSAPAANRLWCEVETDWSGLLRSREGAEIEVLGETPALAGTAIPPATIGAVAPRYTHIRRRHWRDGPPFLMADVFLDERLRAKVTPADLRGKTALKLAASIPGVRISDARQALTIGTADVETATLLQVPLNAPVAHVRRAAVDQRGVLILVADGIYRGDVVRIDIKLR